MLYMIPVVIGISLVLGYSLSPDHTNLEAHSSATLEANLVLQHRQAVNLAEETDMTSGVIDTAISGPFRKMGDWESEVLTQDGKTIVLTYIPERLTDLDRNSARAFNSITKASLKGLPESYYGPYVYGVTGGYIGSGDFTGMSLPLSADFPAIVTVIDYSVTTPSGAGGSDGSGATGQDGTTASFDPGYTTDPSAGSGSTSSSNGKAPGWSHAKGKGSANSVFNR